MLSSVANSTYGGHLLYVEFDRLALNNQNMDSLLLLHIKYWSISPSLQLFTSSFNDTYTHLSRQVLHSESF